MLSGREVFQPASETKRVQRTTRLVNILQMAAKLHLREAEVGDASFAADSLLPGLGAITVVNW